MERDKNIFLKGTIESLFGKEAWDDLKESGCLSTWKRNTKKTFKAVRISIEQTVHHYDKEWLDAIKNTINEGGERVRICKSVDEVIAVLAGTFINLSFLQIGFMPQRRGEKKISLRKSEWELSDFRSVIYLQSVKQREACFWHVQQKEMGVKTQRELRDKYRVSKTPLSYMEWCELQVVS